MLFFSLTLVGTSDDGGALWANMGGDWVACCIGVVMSLFVICGHCMVGVEWMFNRVDEKK